jgi:hypothetical protein
MERTRPPDFSALSLVPQVTKERTSERTAKPKASALNLQQPAVSLFVLCYHCACLCTCVRVCGMRLNVHVRVTLLYLCL